MGEGALFSLSHLCVCVCVYLACVWEQTMGRRAFFCSLFTLRTCLQHCFVFCAPSDAVLETRNSCTRCTVNGRALDPDDRSNFVCVSGCDSPITDIENDQCVADPLTNIRRTWYPSRNNILLPTQLPLTLNFHTS